jgi:uncharacterized membrane protein
VAIKGTMFTPPGYRKRLLADLERWAETGVISRAAADAIAVEYKTDSSRAILTVLAFVFAILAAGGLIALVAANWNAIPREVRVVGLLTINLATLGACLAFRLMRKPGSLAIETSAALSVAAAAASISLMGQIYHLPSNYPGFGLAMMCVAGATALVARSTACLWLAAIAQYGYHVATATERPGYSSYVVLNLAQWTSVEWIFLAFSVFLITLAVSRWTVRGGPWTIFAAMLPLFWWIDSFELVADRIGLSLAWATCGIVVAALLARELRPGDRFDEATSALIGIFAIGAVALFIQISTWIGPMHGNGLAGWRGVLAVGAAAALAIAAAVRRYPDRSRLWWLAAAMAMPFVAGGLLPDDPDRMSPPIEIFRVILVVVLPLGLLAIEARLSERRKTFAFAIAAMILIVIAEVWGTKDLVSLAFVLLGGSVLLGGAILLTRFLSARQPAPAGGGAS